MYSVVKGRLLLFYYFISKGKRFDSPGNGRKSKNSGTFICRVRNLFYYITTKINYKIPGDLSRENITVAMLLYVAT